MIQKQADAGIVDVIITILQRRFVFWVFVQGCPVDVDIGQGCKEQGGSCFEKLILGRWRSGRTHLPNWIQLFVWGKLHRRFESYPPFFEK